MKNSLDLNVRVEVNRVTSTRRNQKERANSSAPLSRTDFNGYGVSGGGDSSCSSSYYFFCFCFCISSSSSSSSSSSRIVGRAK